MIIAKDFLDCIFKHNIRQPRKTTIWGADTKY